MELGLIIGGSVLAGLVLLWGRYSYPRDAATARASEERTRGRR